MGQGPVLDSWFPYDAYKIIPVTNTLVSQDTPWTRLDRTDGTQFFDSYWRRDSFDTYLIYKPKGHNDHTIWVTLSVIHWGWSGLAIYNASTNKWQAPFPTLSGGGNGTPTSYLPEWDKRVHSGNFAWVDI